MDSLLAALEAETQAARDTGYLAAHVSYISRIARELEYRSIQCPGWDEGEEGVSALEKVFRALEREYE